MNIDRRLVWAFPCFALLALGFAYGMRHKLAAPFAKEEAPDPFGTPTSVVALYNERPNVHVADVAVGPKGAKLIEAADSELGHDLKAALAELAARPFLPVMGDGGGGDAAIGVIETKPGDEQYPWAIGGFLRERTGLRYEVRPYVKPPAP